MKKALSFLLTLAMLVGTVNFSVSNFFTPLTAHATVTTTSSSQQNLALNAKYYYQAISGYYSTGNSDRFSATSTSFSSGKLNDGIIGGSEFYYKETGNSNYVSLMRTSSSGGIDGSGIVFDLLSEKNVTNIKISGYHFSVSHGLFHGYYVSEYTVYGSNDCNNWKELGSKAFQPDQTTHYLTLTFDVPINPTQCRFILITQTYPATNMVFSEIQILGTDRSNVVKFITNSSELPDATINANNINYSYIMNNHPHLFNMESSGKTFSHWTIAGQGRNVSLQSNCFVFPYQEIYLINQLAQKGSVTLYANWTDKNYSNSFSNDDWFVFKNSAEYFCVDENGNKLWHDENGKRIYDIGYEMRDSEYAALIENYNLTKKDVEELIADKWGGSCFGMSLFTILSAASKINLTQYPNFDADNNNVIQQSELNDITKNAANNVGILESHINYYHNSQNYGYIKKLRGDYSKSNESKNLKAIVNALNSSNYPVLLEYDMKFKYEVEGKGEKYRKGIHAVVGYDMRYDSSDNGYHIKIYDCSHNASGGNPFELIIYENNGVYTKNAAVWENAWGSEPFFFKEVITVEDIRNATVIKNASTSGTVNKTLSTANVTPLLRGVLSGASVANGEEYTANKQYTLETNYENFVVSDGTRTAVIENDVLISGDLNIEANGPKNEILAEPLFEYVITSSDDVSGFTVTPYNDEYISNYKTTFYDDSLEGFLTSVETKDIATIVFNTDGSTDTVCEEPIEHTLSFANNASDSFWNHLTINGIDTGFSIFPSNNDVILKSASADTKATIAVNTLLSEKVFEEIEIGTEGVTVTETADRTCAIIKNASTVIEDSLGYSVVFYTDSGSSVSSILDVSGGSKILAPESPTNAGFVFDGWYKEPELLTLWDFENDTVNEDLMLYAGWSVDPEFYHTVVFHTKDGKEMFLVENGQGLSDADIPVAPTENCITYKWSVDNFQNITSDMDVRLDEYLYWLNVDGNTSYKLSANYKALSIGAEIEIDTDLVSPVSPSVEYRWYRNGALIEGYESKTYTLRLEDVGCNIYGCVKGTGNYTGQLNSESVVFSANSTNNTLLFSQLTAAKHIIDNELGHTVSVSFDDTAIDGESLVPTGAIVRVVANDIDIATYIAIVKGDVDNDAIASATDAMALKQFLKANISLKNFGEVAADVNDDGGVSAVDYLALKQMCKESD